jgi:hypothetical protein
LGLCFCCSVPALADETIVLLRHGEKPAAGLGQLNCQGLNRSLALPSVLLKRFGVPNVLYAPNPQAGKKDHGERYSYLRPLATIEPLAIRVGLPVNIAFDMKDLAGLQQDLLQPSNQNARVFIAWEHKRAEQLARQLLQASNGPADQVPVWNGLDFDSLYVISIKRDAQGHLSSSFRVERQQLNGLSAVCPGV